MSLSLHPLSKAEKSVLRVCLPVIVPLAGVVYLYGTRDAEPTWDIPAVARRPTPNGYDFYVAAAKARVYFSPPVDPITDTSGGAPSSTYVFKNYSLVRRQQWLKANAKTFALIDRGLNTPSMAPTYAGGPNKNWGQLRELGRAMSVRTRTFQMQHQPMRATMSSLEGIQMGQDSTREGGHLARMVGIAIMSVSRDPLDDWNKTIDALSASEARIAARRLETLLAHEPTAEQTLITEKRGNLLELRHTFSTEGWRGSWGSQEIMDGIHETPARIWQRQMTSKQTIYDNMNRVLNSNIARSKLPYSKAKMPIEFPGLDVFTWYLSSKDSYFKVEARNTTSNTMLLLRLALRAYIAEHGAAPPALAALVPGTLKNIPTDVYNDGKPLFYMPLGKIYKLWSVGPDGINNGGVPFPPRGAGKAPVMNTLDNKGDFVAGLCR